MVLSDCPQGQDALALLGDAGFGGLVGFEQCADQVFAQGGGQALDQVFGVFGELVDGQAHAQAEFGVVLEEGIGPDRTAALGVGAVGGGGQIAAKDRRAAGGVGDQQAVADQLRQQFEIRALRRSPSRRRKTQTAAGRTGRL